MMKMLVLVALEILMFGFASDEAMEAYAGISRLGSGGFLVVQLIIVLDVAFTWNENWANREHGGWIGGLLAATLVMYVGTWVLFARMYDSYAPNRECHRNIAMITTTLVLCVVITLATLHPQSREGCLLPSAVVTLYMAYLCYSALSSEPSSYDCRPHSFIDVDENLRKPANTVATAFTLVSVVYATVRAGESSFWNMDADASPLSVELNEALRGEEEIHQTLQTTKTGMKKMVNQSSIPTRSSTPSSYWPRCTPQLYSPPGASAAQMTPKQSTPDGPRFG